MEYVLLLGYFLHLSGLDLPHINSNIKYSLYTDSPQYITVIELENVKMLLLNRNF